ncbi:MAG: polyribonucleotide nucleotidyltransferase [Anaerolineae bacterium]|nr:polyribonucleotide nucleotidyltransferase [Anaerolineae bacterium]
MAFNESHTFKTQFGRDELVVETGRLAMQANAAVTLRTGDTMILVTATMSQEPREGIDFFPLVVDYEERMYAAGRIPGSFFRREGRSSAESILISRLTDRPLRPLFEDHIRQEVQIVILPLSHDQEHPTDILSIIGASAALTISDIPWGGPVAAVRVGMIDGKFIVNPTFSEMESSVLDLKVAGTRDALIMVECGANEVDETVMVDALVFAHETIQPLIDLQLQMREAVGKEKLVIAPPEMNEALVDAVKTRVADPIRQMVRDHIDRHELNRAVDALQTEVLAEYAEGETADPVLIRETVQKVLKETVRRRILDEGIRPDGRDYTTIRPLAATVGMIPRTHGSGLFQRGETQVLSLATLGTPRDARELDGLDPLTSKRYMHHYNFPPFSTGETKPIRGPGRREIGHGALAENALQPMIPDEDEFPYTIRVVSEVLSSNGSTSMASVCGSTLALMDAGVPIKRPVGGIAMGLITDGQKYAVLTDIQGMEDHLGDMDFKVAGTRDGITALQMDLKVAGISTDVMKRALEQARAARMQILDVMTSTIPEPRQQMSIFAPRMTIIHIDPDKIGTVIGPGGKTIRGIQDETGAKIDIEEDGTIFVAAADGTAADKAVEQIRLLTEDAEIGRIYTGTVVRVEPYGCFVEFLPGQDGMVHISQLSDRHIAKVEDEVRMGDEIMVMVTDVDPVTNKVRLSRRAVLEGWSAEEAREYDRPGGGSGGRRGGGGSSRRGGSSGSGDRRRRR